jgi:hypothetical protein
MPIERSEIYVGNLLATGAHKRQPGHIGDDRGADRRVEHRWSLHCRARIPQADDSLSVRFRNCSFFGALSLTLFAP